MRGFSVQRHEARLPKSQQVLLLAATLVAFGCAPNSPKPSTPNSPTPITITGASGTNGGAIVIDHAGHYRYELGTPCPGGLQLTSNQGTVVRLGIVDGPIHQTGQTHLAAGRWVGVCAIPPVCQATCSPQATFQIVPILWELKLTALD